MCPKLKHAKSQQSSSRGAFFKFLVEWMGVGKFNGKLAIFWKWQDIWPMLLLLIIGSAIRPVICDGNH